MIPGTIRALEFERIVSAVAAQAVTPTGRERLLELHPMTDAVRVAAAQRATTEGVRLLEDHGGLRLRAPDDLTAILGSLTVEGRALEPLRLLGLATYLESVEGARATVSKLIGPFPVLRDLASAIASFAGEVAAVRRAIEPGGDVADHASPALGAIRERLRRLRAKIRTTLDGLVRGRDTAKYLQEQVITDRNGRYVLMVRAEHRSAIPGLVHGTSSSGATLFLEPLETVEINNDVVAMEEEEAEEVRRILLALTDGFRGRPSDLRRTIEVATELDAIQARARFSRMVDGVEPLMSTDGTLELRGARHPLLVLREGVSRPPSPVPVDILLAPPVRVLVIAGPNTGGKTVALKTAGLLALMAQAGLHVPANPGSRAPVFQTVFADIGDEQSIAASLSTFSAHIANVVSMDRALRLPALILLDEVGAGTDPVEGGALGAAVIEHFRTRGAHVVATTHYDTLKSYASTTEGAAGAAFGFDPDTFAPTYQLIYGSPGRSLAIEMAARLGLPGSVITAARGNLTDREKQLGEHLDRVERERRAVEEERRHLLRDRLAVAETERKVRSREEAVRERETAARRRLETKLGDQVREARREIDAIMEDIRIRASELRQARRAGTAGTGQAGAIRAEAREAIDRVVERSRPSGDAPAAPVAPVAPEARAGVLAPGVTVSVGALGLQGTLVGVRAGLAEIDVRGKRLRAPVRDLQAVGGAPAAPSVTVSIDLQPRQASPSEINLVGCTVDEAVARLEKFLDEATVADQRELRVVHGHGTGQLREGVARFLRAHPLVAEFGSAPTHEGGGGVTVVALKD
jgi:DNA mismatch repair protein MutS2